MEYLLSGIVVGLLCGAIAGFFWCGKITRTRLDESAHKSASQESALALSQQAQQYADSRCQELQTEVRQQASLLQQQRQAAEEKTTELTRELAQRDAKIASLETQIRHEQQASQEKLGLLEQAEQRLSKNFELLANRILEEKGKQFTEQNHASISSILSPLREQLGNFRNRIDDVYEKEAKDRRTLYDEVVNLKSLNERLGQEAHDLAQALKGDSKRRGDWGEIVLERVLESSGLRAGHEYHVQQTLRDEHGRLRRPDVIVHLPGDRHVVIDAKVSLNAFERYHAAEDADERRRCLQQHADSLRRHVRDLQQKDYSALEGLKTPDMILMFVPVEPALQCAFEQDWELFQDAFNNGIFVVSPSSLIMNLRLIHNLWRHEHQNRNANRIAARAGHLYDKFVLFVEALEDIGDKLDKSVTSWRTAFERLSTGRGNLLGQIEALRKLGDLDTKKSLPALTEAEEDTETRLRLAASPVDATEECPAQAATAGTQDHAS